MPNKTVIPHNLTHGFLSRVENFLNGRLNNPEMFALIYRCLYRQDEIINFLIIEKRFNEFDEELLLRLFQVFDLKMDELQVYISVDSPELLMLNMRYPLWRGAVNTYTKATKALSFNSGEGRKMLCFSGKSNSRLITARYEAEETADTYSLELFSYGLRKEEQPPSFLSNPEIVKSTVDWSAGMVTPLMAKLTRNPNKIIFRDNFPILGKLGLKYPIPLEFNSTV